MKVPVEWLLVDGYNLLHSWKRNFYQEERPEDARDSLVQQFMEYSGYYFIKVVVVFDGQGTMTTRDQQSDLLDVIYTTSLESADQWIEKKTFQLIREGWKVKVVTSDRVEQQVVFGSGALRIPTGEMIREMFEMNASIKSESEKRKGHARREEVFGRLDQETSEKLNKIRFQGGNDQGNS